VVTAVGVCEWSEMRRDEGMGCWCDWIPTEAAEPLTAARNAVRALLNKLAMVMMANLIVKKR
jgi:hypothetical protein